MKIPQPLVINNAPFDNQPSDVRSMPADNADRLVISYAKIAERYVPLSFYGDEKWNLGIGPTNRAKASCYINFKHIPASFRATTKAMAWHYKKRGREGGVRPSISTLISWFRCTSLFLNWVAECHILQLQAVTPSACMNYVQYCKGRLSSRGKPVSPGTLEHLFVSVEAIYELSQYTDDPMLCHPWPESSAKHLAGLTDSQRDKESKTPLFPDNIFSTLFQWAWEKVQRGDWLLDLRDEIDRVESEYACSDLTTINKYRNRCLKKNGFNGVSSDFSREILALRNACYIVVASLTGCRNHELAAIESKAYYSSVNTDGEVFWWMRSRSQKTGEGLTEWMIPENAVKALAVMDRWAKPYQNQIENEIALRSATDFNDPEIAEAQKHRKAVFLAENTKFKNRTRTLTSPGWSCALKDLKDEIGLDWHLSTHQFRRKFANYAAHSQFGDLRYLKEHFKHWSMDMTLSYALNGSQDLELYLEIQDELDDIKLGVVAEWLKPEEPLAGGLGKRVMEWRGKNPVTLFKDHGAMVRTLAESVPIRSNLHSWCTADEGDCVGRDGLDSLRCTECEHGVIGKQHAYIYQKQLFDLQGLLDAQDIGLAGLERVRFNINRCKATLDALGMSADPFDITEASRSHE